jgi:hypothetical protein
MEKFWLKHKVAISLATLGALFHVIYVVYALATIGNRGGELHQWYVTDKFVIVDFPLYLFIFVLPDLGIRASSTLLILYFSFFGTLMYVLVGWTLGWVVDCLRRLSQRRLSQKP